MGELEVAVDGLGGETVEDWVTNAAAVDAALENLRGIAGDELDLAGFDTALADLNTAIEGGDLAAIATAAEGVDAAMAHLLTKVDEPAATTTTTAAPTATTAAPAGGVASGAGGTADTSASPISVLVGASLVSLLLAGLYTVRRRSEG